MLDLFEITAGTIPGRRHVGSGNLLVGRNNQDAYGIVVDSEVTVLTVYDGCGSGAHTEVGAKLASKIVPSVIANAYLSGRVTFADSAARYSEWRNIKESILGKLQCIAMQMLGPVDSVVWDQMISDYMLFTVFGALVTKTHTAIFSIGDGIYSINGQCRSIGPFEGNAPPYIGYALMLCEHQGASDFVIHEVQPTNLVHSLVIGTDGLVELDAKAGMRVPGKDKGLCSVAELSNDEFFAADQSLTCWLRQINSEVVRLENGTEPRIKREHGLLTDDTTLVVARRRR